MQILDKKNFINRTVSDRVEIKLRNGVTTTGTTRNKLTNKMWRFPASLAND